MSLIPPTLPRRRHWNSLERNKGDMDANPVREHQHNYNGRNEGTDISKHAGVRVSGPLSYHQERLWFIDQFETGQIYPTSPIYHNIPLILYLEGPIDIQLLER